MLGLGSLPVQKYIRPERPAITFQIQRRIRAEYASITGGQNKPPTSRFYPSLTSTRMYVFYDVIVLMLVSQRITRSQRVNQPPGAFRVVIDFRILNFGEKQQSKEDLV